MVRSDPFYRDPLNIIHLIPYTAVCGWFPAETITISEAIRAYSDNTAYANFEEKIKGSIEVGKFADLTVLTKNLLRIPAKELLNTEVVYTIVNGKIVYEKNEAPAKRLVETGQDEVKMKRRRFPFAVTTENGKRYLSETTGVGDSSPHIRSKSPRLVWKSIGS